MKRKTIPLVVLAAVALLAITPSKVFAENIARYWLGGYLGQSVSVFAYSAASVFIIIAEFLLLAGCFCFGHAYIDKRYSPTSNIFGWVIIFLVLILYFWANQWVHM